MAVMKSMLQELRQQIDEQREVIQTEKEMQQIQVSIHLFIYCLHCYNCLCIPDK